MTTPILGGTTLPEPNEYEEVEEYRGAGRLMASGAVVYDLLSATAKHVYTLTWDALTGAEKATVKTAFATVKTSSAAFTTLEGASVTVTRDPGEDDITFTAVPAANGTRWKASMKLRGGIG